MTTTVHRLDCFKSEVSRGLRNVDLVVTDPPYGGIVDEAWDDEWSLDHYRRLGSLLTTSLKPGGTAYVWGGIGKPPIQMGNGTSIRLNRPFFQWLGEVEEIGLTIHNLITWSKRRAYGKADNYLFTREECVMLVKGKKPVTFNVPLLAKKRGYAGYNLDYPAKSEFLRRTSVWTDVNEIFSGKIHPCEKPSRLAEIMIETSCNPGEVVVDYFAGSGSTGVAANKLDRECILFERSDCAMHEV